MLLKNINKMIRLIKFLIWIGSLVITNIALAVTFYANLALGKLIVKLYFLVIACFKACFKFCIKVNMDYSYLFFFNPIFVISYWRR
jgi:hypothetical protein